MVTKETTVEVMVGTKVDKETTAKATVVMKAERGIIQEATAEMVVMEVDTYGCSRTFD